MKKGLIQLLTLGIFLSCSFMACQSCNTQSADINHTRDINDAKSKPEMTKLGKAADAITNPCMQDANCEDLICQQRIADTHEVDSIKFHAMKSIYLSEYGDDDNEKDSIFILVSTLEKAMDGLDCRNGDYIGFHRYYKDTRIRLVACTDISKSAADSFISEPEIHGRYSIPFFRGLIAKYKLAPTDTLFFYKAVATIDGRPQPTIALRLTDKRIASKPVPAYADLSQYYP